MEKHFETCQSMFDAENSDVINKTAQNKKLRTCMV